MKALIVLFILSTFSAYAADGAGGGNGGDVIVCPRTIELLDNYEMRQKSGFYSARYIDLPGSTIREKVNSAIARLNRLDQKRAKTLTAYANDFLSDIENHENAYPMKETQFDSVNLPDVDDSYEMPLEILCHKEQLIIQKDPKTNGGIRYTVADQLWSQLSMKQKALAVLHEVWYRMLIGYGAKDSIYVRHMNRLFASHETDNFTLNDYARELASGNKYGIYIKFEWPENMYKN